MPSSPGKHGRASGIAIAIAASLMARVAIEGARPAAPRPGALALPDARGPSRASLVSPPRIEIAGCKTVIALEGAAPPVCQVPEDGALRVWVDAAEGDRVLVRANAGAAIERPLPRGEGRLFDARVRADVPWIRVEIERPSAGFAETPALAPARRPDRADALAASRRSDPRQAEAIARAWMAGDDPAIAARAAGIAARIRREEGDLDAARELFTRAIEADVATGHVSDLYLDSFALAYTLGVQLRRFDDARAVLADLAKLARAGFVSPQHEARAPYYAGLIAHEAGDLRSALAGYRASREHAARLGEEAHIADVLSQEALVLLDLGRGHEGAARYEEAAPLITSLGACAKATFFNNWSGFLVQLAAIDPGASHPSIHVAPSVPLARAVALVERDCPDDRLRGFVAMNRAQVGLLDSDMTAAREAIRAAAASLVRSDKHDAAELADVEEQVATAEGDIPAAWSANQRLTEIAENAVLPYYRRRAALGRAELLELAGDADGAQSAFEEAERLVVQDSLLAPLGEGRLGFLEQLSRGPAEHVALLLERPRGAALAANVARRSIAHMLSSLETATRIEGMTGDERRAWESRIAAYRRERERIEDEARDDWKLSSEERARAAADRRSREERAREALDRALAARRASPAHPLSAPREGELFLVYFRIGRDTWAGFAIDASGTTARVLPATSDLGERFLAPFRARIDRARHVRFFVPSALRDIDFHALPYDGAPLIERVPVTYGLDVRDEPPPADRPSIPWDPNQPAPAPSIPWDPNHPFAMIVADPSGGLPQARVEGEAVRRRIEAIGVTAALLGAQGEPPTSERVRAHLARGAFLFHFAGHARFSGTDGWESAIPLADGGALTVGDVLALSPAPRLVVLSGCETGRSDGLGLAHAFVAAGAQAAVGTTRVVPDAAAARVMALFYENLQPGPSEADAASLALRAAVRALLREHRASGVPDDAVDWKSFRVFVP